MARWEQFEVWAQNGARWELIGSFNDLEVASTLARNRSNRMRLVHAVYEDSKRVEEDVLAEVGVTRKE